MRPAETRPRGRQKGLIKFWKVLLSWAFRDVKKAEGQERMAKKLHTRQEHANNYINRVKSLIMTENTKNVIYLNLNLIFGIN